MTDGIGVRIARRRQQLRMTQEELAARIGVAKSTVANWETGKHFPLRKLGAVEEALGIRLDEEPPKNPMPPGLRDHIRELFPADVAARVEANIEAVLRGETPPAKRNGGAGTSAKAG